MTRFNVSLCREWKDPGCSFPIPRVMCLRGNIVHSMPAMRVTAIVSSEPISRRLAEVDTAETTQQKLRIHIHTGSVKGTRLSHVQTPHSITEMHSGTLEISPLQSHHPILARSAQGIGSAGLETVLRR
uniref:Uncharacterized protein n=1 Tax=Physcomitrium patens TaxID=3218 RepID=A0A2K1K634_PHYPA|nr:hypothetical protein PHYPA_011135 [Physcomitrium patens]